MMTKQIKIGKSTLPVQNHPLVVIIDAQNDFCLPKSGCAYYDRAISENRLDDMLHILEAFQAIKRLLRLNIKHKFNIVALQSSYSPNQFSVKSPMNRLALRDSFGWQLALELPKGAIAIEKLEHDGSANLLSAFPHTSHFVLCGFTTDNCVSTTAEGLLNKGVDVTVLSDCTATATYKYPQYHQSALNKLDKLGVCVIKSDLFLYDLINQNNSKEQKVG